VAEEAVVSAQVATDIAMGFLKPHRTFANPVKASREGKLWTVLVDVGAIKTIIATVHIDAATGAITDYDIPVPIWR